MAGTSLDIQTVENGWVVTIQHHPEHTGLLGIGLRQAQVAETEVFRDAAAKQEIDRKRQAVFNDPVVMIGWISDKLRDRFIGEAERGTGGQ